jgi:hypothetical protein
MNVGAKSPFAPERGFADKGQSVTLENGNVVSPRKLWTHADTREGTYEMPDVLVPVPTGTSLANMTPNQAKSRLEKKKRKKRQFISPRKSTAPYLIIEVPS